MSEGLRIGVDEAGLGPTLGPLVIGSFATEGPASLRSALSAAIGPPGAKPPRLEVGDSKKIHQGVHKLARIERTVLATVAWTLDLPDLPTSPSELLARVGIGFDEDDALPPWYRDLVDVLPVAADPDQIAKGVERLRRATQRTGVRPMAYRADVIPAVRINRELRDEDDDDGTKNTWATHAVLRVARKTVELAGAGDAVIWCDKAGGRSSYATPLARAFPHHHIDTVDECRERSEYRLRSLFTPGEVGLGFVMKGDSLDPRISWASCLAKYLRELVMLAFNRYWSSVADEPPRPTAGYPEDARRFIEEVRLGASDAGIPETRWIRAK